MASGEISHRGRIIKIGNGSALVEIVSQSACSTCHAAGLCGTSESEKKNIEARVWNPEAYSIGQEVEVCLSQKMGLKAVLLSYVIPLLILLILILTLLNIMSSELIAGLIGIAGVAVYYFILWFFRKSLRNDYEFYIKG